MFKKKRVDEIEELQQQLLEYKAMLKMSYAALRSASNNDERDRIADHYHQLKIKLLPEIAFIKARIAYITKERTDSKTIDPQVLKKILID